MEDERKVEKKGVLTEELLKKQRDFFIGYLDYKRA